MVGLVVIPTFNEIHTVRTVVSELLSDASACTTPRWSARKDCAGPDWHKALAAAPLSVLVVDDSSPDGTSEAVRELASEYPVGVVNLLVRPRAEGLASAYRAGFAWGLERNYDVIVQMDADGSHPVGTVPELVAAVSSGSDLALGARYIPGGSTDPQWGLHRKVLSLAGNTYARWMLQLPYRDLTGGFKAWRSDLLREISPVGGKLSGYAFQIHTTYAAHRAGAHIVEVPFHFTDRAYGVSKMHGRIVTEGLAAVVAMRLHPPGPARK